MSEHTKGPWITNTTHKHERDGMTIWSGGLVIADVVPDQHDQHEANARLIAAAPDLLDALKGLAKQEDWEGEDISPESPVGKAWAAIAKAVKC